MTRRKRIYTIAPGMLILILLFPDSLHAQEPIRSISIQEAIHQLADQNLILESARARIVSAEAYIRQASVLPNPSLQITREQLNLGTTDLSETYLNLSQQMEWPGTRNARIQTRSFEAQVAIESYRLEHIRLALDVGTTYVTAVAAEEHIQILEEVTEVIRQAERSGTIRTQEGDFSGYDRRRLKLERVRYDELLAEQGLEVSRLQRGLAQLIEPVDGLKRIGTTEMPEKIPALLNLSAALKLGLEQRPESALMDSELQTTKARLQLSRKERLPDFTFTFGYKNQSDEFKGFFTGLSLPLAVFDRREGEIEARSAQVTDAGFRLAQTIREIETEIRNTHETALSRYNRLRPFQEGISEDLSTLLESARLSYEMGEISLLELIDAASAYRDARIMLVDLQAACWTAYFDLQRAMGVLPMATPETGGEGS